MTAFHPKQTLGQRSYAAELYREVNLNQRRRLGALSGAAVAIAAGLSGFIARRDDTSNPYIFLMGLGVGLAVGLLVVLVVKRRR